MLEWWILCSFMILYPFDISQYETKRHTKDTRIESGSCLWISESMIRSQIKMNSKWPATRLRAFNFHKTFETFFYGWQNMIQRAVRSWHNYFIYLWEVKCTFFNSYFHCFFFAFTFCSCIGFAPNGFSFAALFLINFLLLFRFSFANRHE